MAHDLTEVDSYGAVVTVPDDGDDANALSVETPFQQLANRAKNLKGRLDGIVATLSASAFTWAATHLFTGALRSNVGLGLYGAADEVLYTNSSGASVPRSRAIPVPMWPTTDAYEVISSTSFDGLLCAGAGTSTHPMPTMPRGVTPGLMLVGVVAPSSAVTVKIYRVIHNLSGSGSPTVTEIDSATTVGTSYEGLILDWQTSGAFVVDNTNERYFFSIVWGAALQEVRGAQMVYADLGPRNG